MLLSLVYLYLFAQKESVLYIFNSFQIKDYQSYYTH